MYMYMYIIYIYIGCEPEISNFGLQTEIENFLALEQGVGGPILKGPNGI